MIQVAFKNNYNWLLTQHTPTQLRTYGLLVVHLAFTILCPIVFFIIHKTQIISKKYKTHDQQNKELASAKTQFYYTIWVLFNQLLIQLPLNVILIMLWYNIGCEVHYKYDDLSPWYNILLRLFICLIFEDAFGYFLHIILHHKSVYGYIHKYHHDNTSPFPHWADYAHPLETILKSIAFELALILFCDHLYLMYLWLLIHLCETYNSHPGYDVPLQSGNLFKLIPGYAGARHNAFHHRNVTGNFAITFRWFDILFGTIKQHEIDEQKKRNAKCIQISKDMIKNQEINEKYQFVAASLGATSIPKKCVVTGGNGMVGRQLIKMLLKRGAEKVISIDISPPPIANDDNRIIWIQTDITDYNQLKSSKAFEGGIDAVFHIAAIVGPFHAHSDYIKVNYYGTKNIIKCCKENNITALIECSSPATRYSWDDINGYSENDFIRLRGGDPYPKKYTHEYARTKALGEKAILAANNTDGLYTTVIAPHQVYGNCDQLFIPNILITAVSGKLFIFGDGNSIVSFTHVNNVCHALILAAISLLNDKTRQISGGGFYFVTDDNCYNIWDQIDKLIQLLNDSNFNVTPIKYRIHLNKYFLYLIGYFGVLYTKITGKYVKLTPFTVRMMTMNRYFNIGKIKQELGFKPLIKFEEGWVKVGKFIIDRMKKAKQI